MAQREKYRKKQIASLLQQVEVAVASGKTTVQASKETELETNVDTAFQRIRKLILHGQLAPGTWIMESDLCEHLNMSRTPVRNALSLLQREGYLIRRVCVSRSHMIVTPLTNEDANELYSIMGRIEGLAGWQAAALPVSERNALVAKLKPVNDRLAQIAKERNTDGPDTFDLDHEFHRLLMDVGTGPRLSALHKMIEPQTERYWRLYASSDHNLQVTVLEHKEILTALVAGDSERLESALKANWENGCKRLSDIIDIVGERGKW